MEKLYNISILSQKLTLRNDAGCEEYVSRVVDFVTRKIQEVTNQNSAASTLTAALLACLNITDEFFRYREAKEVIHQSVVKKVQHLMSLVDSHEETHEDSKTRVAL